MIEVDVQAVALFGSRARGNSDSLSDTDILLVDADKRKLLGASLVMERRGFSVSAFTWRTLELMKSAGALFLQHLKSESVVIKDDRRQLQELLLSFNPRYDYSRDIEHTKRLMAATYATTGSRVSLGWAMDVLAVGVRNISILTLANQGEYCFSYEQLMKRMNAMRVLPRDETRLLMDLRFYRRAYRAGEYSAIPGQETMGRLRRIMWRRFGVDIESRTVTTDWMVGSALAEARLHSGKYERFRLCEGALAMLIAEDATKWAPLRGPFFSIVSHQNRWALNSTDLSISLRELLTHAVGEARTGDDGESPMRTPAGAVGSFAY